MKLRAYYHVKESSRDYCISQRYNSSGKYVDNFDEDSPGESDDLDFDDGLYNLQHCKFKLTDTDVVNTRTYHIHYHIPNHHFENNALKSDFFSFHGIWLLCNHTQTSFECGCIQLSIYRITHVRRLWSFRVIAKTILAIIRLRRRQ